VREKLPLILLAVASSAVTFVAQRRGGAVSGLDVMPPARRVANALVAYVAYIGKMLWPADLSVFYPYPRSVPVWQVIGALVVLLGASFLVARLARRRPYLAVGWLWYLGTLVPVIGLIQVGTQAMADRYTYVPLIGVFIVIAWGVPDLFARWPRAAWRANAAAAAIAILASAVVARGQAAVWSTSDTLWRHALTVDPANYYAQNAVGRLDAERGRLAEAMTHFAESVRLAPNFPDAYDNLGLALARQGRFAEAIAQYRNALRIDPDSAEAHNNLGAALMKNGKAEEATAQYAEAIRLDPDSATAHNNMGQALAGLGRTADAIAQYEVALRLQPDLADAHDGLGLALASLGRMADAVAQYTEALRLNPASAGTHNNLATALTALGRADEAIAQYTEAIRLDPGNAAVHNNLGFVLAGQGRVAEAIPQFTEAVRLAPDFEMAHLYLGLALAGAGRFDEAAAEFVEVLRLNPNNEGAKRALDTLAKRRAARNTR
jgi:tetratricopeptide (TPR) repeat protein